MNALLQGLTTAVDRLAAFAPRLIAGLLVLLIGYVVAVVLARLIGKLLPRIHLERVHARLGTGRTYDPGNTARWTSKLVFWIVMLVTIMQVARIWELTFVAVGFAALLAYLPHVLAAAVIIGVALALGNWVRDRVARTPALVGDGGGGGEMRLLPSILRAGIITIGAFMALRELQIAPQIVNLAFTLTLGAIALAAALAFGLGGRDVAGRIAQSWYERRREAASRVRKDVAVAPGE